MTEQFIPQTRTRSEFVAEAKTWIGTPYAEMHVTARCKKGSRADCIFWTQVAADLGMYQIPTIAYTANPKGQLVRKYIEKHVTVVQSVDEGPINFAEIKPGQIGLFYYRDPAEPQHCAVFFDHPAIPGYHGMIHAYNRRRKVIDGGLENNKFWTQRLMYVYDVPHITDDAP